MGSYYCDYQGDDGYLNKRVTIDVYLIDLTIGVRGQRIGTTPATDRDLIPPIWFDYCFVEERGKGYCSLSINPRNALLWIGNTTYLFVPLPWQGNTAQFNEFFRYAGEENRNKYVKVGLNGEFIPAEWLKYLAQ